MPGVLYFVTSYRRPEQVLRLAGTIARESPGAELLVHHDQFRSKLDASELRTAAPGAHLLTSPEPLRWGDFSVVDMHWRGFEWAAEHREFDWLVLLSEQDYPVWPFERTEQFLRGAGADAFLKAAPVDPVPPFSDALSYHRYFYSYSAVPGASTVHRVPVPWAGSWRAWRQRAVNRVNRRDGQWVRAETYPDGMPTRFGVRRTPGPFSSSFPCWVGKAWFALSRRAVCGVVSHTRSHPEYRRYYERTIVPEESATATIVMNSKELRVIDQELHFERWSDRFSGHPDVFGTADLEAIAASDMPFARKFDLGTGSDALDTLDRLRQGSA